MMNITGILRIIIFIPIIELTINEKEEQDKNKKLNIEGGTFLMRFGESKYTGASVSHLHCNLLQSDPDHPEYEKTRGVMTRVG